MSRPADNGARALIIDVAASWQDYSSIRHAMAATLPAGLLLHAAGATDEGFRTIDVWDSDDAFAVYQALLTRAFDDLAVAPIVRALQVDHLVTRKARQS